jgi:hypothetical protein
MTSIATIEAAWTTYIFENADFLAISPNVLDHEYQDGSNTEIERLYTEGENGVGEVNFWEYAITRRELIDLAGGASRPEYEFDVDIQYTKQIRVDGTTQKTVIAAIETLTNLVRSELGSTWGSLYMRLANEVIPEQIKKEDVNGAACIRQAVRFTASRQ